MATSTSTVPSVKRALLALLADRPDLAGVQLAWSRPSLDAMQNEVIWFGDTEIKETTRALGRQRRDETAVIELVISVQRDGDDAETCEQRTWALAGEVELTLRDNSEVPGGNSGLLGADDRVFWVHLIATKQTNGQAEGKRITEAVLSLECRGRIN